MSGTHKIAIVTGASRGIGAATAKLLAADGYAVCVNYLNSKAKADAVVAEITKAGGKAIAVAADVSKEADIIHLFQTVDKELGSVTALVNNAVVQEVKRVEETSMALLEATFQANVFGVFIACREAINRMKKTGGGIVNISSEAAKFGGNRMTAYAASKAAISTFTIGFAREAAAYGVRVNAVSPGIIDTDAHSGAPAERLEGLKASIPMGRMGTAGEVAQTIAWLLSDKASYISGAVLPVTGAR